MSRSFKYLAFAGSSVLSCVVAYKLQSTAGGGKETGTLYAAAASAEVLRSGLGNPTIAWDKNWDFREPVGVNSYSSRRHGNELKKNVPSLAERFEGDQTAVPVVDGKPSATRHLVFIRHGQYAKGDDDKNKILTYLGRYNYTVKSLS